MIIILIFIKFFGVFMTLNSLNSNKSKFKAIALSLFTLLTGCYTNTILANANNQQEPLTSTAQQIVLHSSITNKDYHIYISVPQQAAPSTGYPIIYLLDGHLTFSRAESLANNLIEQGIIKPIVIVAIDYKEQEQWLTFRAQDYTPSHNSTITNDPFIKGEENGGGAEKFLKFITTELKPLIEQKYNIDSQQQALFGHSYGGLFTLFTSFTKPDSFQYYYAASPSIWWDNKAIIRESSHFINSQTTYNKPPQLIISVGGLEQTAPVNSPAARKEKLLKRNQVTNAKELADLLNKDASTKLHTRFFIFPEQNHGAVIPFAIQQALTSFFSNPPSHH